MEKFFSGFFKALNDTLGYKLIGSFTLADLLMLFNVVFGIWRGWGDGGNSVIGWGLAGWLWLCLKWAQDRTEEEVGLLSGASEVLGLARETIEHQQETITTLKTEVERQQKEIEALKNQGAV